MLSHWDPKKPLSVVVDASSCGFGAALRCGEKVVQLYSVSNSRPYMHNSEAELEAIVCSLRAFRHLTYGRPVAVCTDYWLASKALNPEIYGVTTKRRLHHLQQDYPRLHFVPGIENELANLLSREAYFMTIAQTSTTDSGVSQCLSVDGQFSCDGGEGVQEREETTQKQTRVIEESEAEDEKGEGRTTFLEYLLQMHKRGHYGVDAMMKILKRSEWDTAEARRFVNDFVRTCRS